MSNPQGPLRKPLKDFPRELLESLLETLQAKHPPALVETYEDARDPLKLAYNAGRHAVVREVQTVLKNK